MAQQVVVTLIDDITGEPAVDTVHFGLDGVGYQIDLCEKNAAALREILHKYTTSGRRLPRQRRAETPRPLRRVATSAVSYDRSQYPTIREWARSNGYDVQDRGRIPRQVFQAFHDAHER